MAETQTIRMSGFAKAMMQLQVFLLRRNWLGRMGSFILVITTTGRKSGKKFSTPIGFVRDGDTLLALTRGGISNWYKNVQVNPEVTLEIQGRAQQARTELIKDPAMKQQVFDLYLKAAPMVFERFFGITAASTPEDLARARDGVEFVRFHEIG